MFFLIKNIQRFKPFEPEFTIVVFIHYKPRIPRLVVDEDDLMWLKNKGKLSCIFVLKPLVVGKLNLFSGM